VDHNVFQWVFEVKDPRDHPITAVFFVQQFAEAFSLDDHHGRILLPKLKNEEHFHRTGKRIRWDHVIDTPEFEVTNPNTFIGKANSEIFLLHQKDERTSVFFDTCITLDFQLSFPLNLMPEGILKFMSEAIMSQIMQQATESMLCRVQSDICCSDLDIAASGK
jgi:hypothetical protein